MDVGGRTMQEQLSRAGVRVQSKSIPLIPAFIHMDVKYASNAGAFTCLPRGEKEYKVQTQYLLRNDRGFSA